MLGVQIFEGGQLAKCQPLAYWTFQDCFAYLDKYSLERHPLHEEVPHPLSPPPPSPPLVGASTME